jgi:hypothetical protein
MKDPKIIFKNDGEDDNMIRLTITKKEEQVFEQETGSENTEVQGESLLDSIKNLLEAIYRFIKDMFWYILK